MRRAAVRSWLPPLGWALLLFVLSAQSRVPSLPIPYFDKLEHAVAYGVLAALLMRALRTAAVQPAWAVVLTSLYGITDEVHQAFVPGRSPDVGDWAADTIGALLVLAAFTRLRARRGASSASSSAPPRTLP